MIHYCRYLFVKMKVFNYSELHFSEVTFYRIHTLIKVLVLGRLIVWSALVGVKSNYRFVTLLWIRLYEYLRSSTFQIRSIRPQATTIVGNSMNDNQSRSLFESGAGNYHNGIKYFFKGAFLIQCTLCPKLICLENSFEFI